MRMTLGQLKALIYEAKHTDEDYENVHEVYEELLAFVKSDNEKVKEELDPSGRTGEFTVEDNGRLSFEDLVEAAKSIVWLVTQRTPLITGATRTGCIVENEAVTVSVISWPQTPPKFHVFVYRPE